MWFEWSDNNPALTRWSLVGRQPIAEKGKTLKTATSHHQNDLFWLNDLQMVNRTAAFKGATKVEALPPIIVLSHLWTLGYNKFLFAKVIRWRMITLAGRTFLHVIYGRFGSTEHLLLCNFALLNTLYIVATTIESMLLSYLP
uniref:Uncharacterized protein n=1 Tax=Echinococcus canadensis TaxID=519352 RepID=A0A915EWX8_9CEST